MDIKIAFIGFGEAAQAFTRGWRSRGPIDICAYDIQFDSPATAAAKRAECAAHDVRPVSAANAAAEQADLVFSAVTADQTVIAAQNVAPGMRPDKIFFDINSAAPFRKQEAARIIAAAGGQTVDVAVMSPVHPALHETPLLISGPAAAQSAPILARLGMKLAIVSDVTGDASIIKMVRSIAIKGIESVTMECVTAAVKLGIADRVIPSIAESFSKRDFATLADGVMERVVTHGKRRAAEMREVAATLEHEGLTHFMPTATAAHQQWIADMDVRAKFPDGVPKDARRVAQAILDIADKTPAT